MDYKGKFEDFLDKMQGLLDNAKKQGHIIVRVEDLENTLTEIKDGDEDDRIREELIKHLKDGVEGYMPAGDSEDYARWLAWLEKQGKEKSWKPSKEEMDVLYGLAYITNQYDEHKEEVITRLYQDLKREFFNGSSYENMFPNTSTEDDVRRRSTIQVLEYARTLDTYNQYGKADIDKNIAWLEKQGEQKPAEWSEDDELKRSTLIHVVKKQKGSAIFEGLLPEELIDWLKSLKPNKDMVEALRTEYEKGRADTIAEMKSSWSEEDEERLMKVIWYVDNPAPLVLKDTMLVEWLKSLKGRYTWKPSKVQLECLHDAINHYHANGYPASKLNELYEQMSKIYKL